MQSLLDLLAGRGEQIDLDRAALELARIEYPNLEAEPFVAILDSYAVELADRLDGRASGSDYVEVANRYLFGELGFSGNAQNYYDPRNSCLNEVLTSRTGIPITLAIVYLEIARRLAKPVCGIGLPGHFLVQYRGADFSAFIDVFNGGRVLTPDECYELAGQATGVQIPADPHMLAPASKRHIVMRMINNLRSVYIARKALPKALRTLDLLVEANPNAPDEYKLRGFLHLQMRNPRAARADLETYLRLAPEASDKEEIAKQLRGVKRYMAGLN